MGCLTAPMARSYGSDDFDASLPLGAGEAEAIGLAQELKAD